MRRIKIIPEVGAILTLEMADNNLSVAEFTSLCAAKGFNLDIKSTSLREKFSKATFTESSDMLPDGDITIFTLPKDPKGNI